MVIAFEPSEQVSLLECTLTSDSGEPPSQPDCVSPIQYDGLTERTVYVFEVVATDAAGNVGEPARQEFETDVTSSRKPRPRGRRWWFRFRSTGGASRSARTVSGLTLRI